MQTMTVSASDLMTAKRWDFGFHALRQKYGSDAAELAERFTAEEAREMLSPIETQDLAVLMPLSRSSMDRISKAKAEAAIKEYPHLALAAVVGQMDDVKARAREAIAAAHKYKDVLEGIVERTAKHELAPAA